MSAPTPPDIRSILDVLIAVQHDLVKAGECATAREYRDLATEILDEALQAISAVVLGCAPERKPVDWQDIGTPELIAKQSEAYGYNQAVDLYTDNLRAMLGITKENT